MLGKIVRSIFHQNSTAYFTTKLHYEVLGCGRALHKVSRKCLIFKIRSYSARLDLKNKRSFLRRKRNRSPNFLVRISSGWLGVFHMKGWGPKSSVCSSKRRETKLFGGISREFCRDISGSPKNLSKNVCVQFSSPSSVTQWISNDASCHSTM